MSNFLTPGVYTEEVATLPPSVADVSTAVPAFIGYTEQAMRNSKSVTNQAVRISTFLEFKEIYGSADTTAISVAVDDNDAIQTVSVTPPQHSLYYAMDLYFKNGGGDCYIISVGSYRDAYNKTNFLNGLEALKKEDEPTLIVMGEAAKLPSADYTEVCQTALEQCAELKDRFCIFDIQDEAFIEEGVDPVETFRNGIGVNNLKYGAAYTPHLQTSINHVYREADVNVTGSFSSEGLELIIGGLKVTYTGSISDNPRVKINKTDTIGDGSAFSVVDGLLTIAEVGDGVPVADLITDWETFPLKGNFNLEVVDDPDTLVQSTVEQNVESTAVSSFTLADMKGMKSALHSQIVMELAKERIILPPSAAIAGAYATTDRERGVWKAPANVSLKAVLDSTKKITSAEQEKLNIDADAGKSINAIRSFTGKGVMVWGARTLAGNDNEWRYISVRRLFNMIEESTKKASEFAVFESNDAVTWLKVKAMIDSYLYGIWQQGALAGSVSEQAYFVNIGLGKTMTQQDILEGRMVVEIGIAAVRPAEFIVLKFSHKLQESA